MTRLKLGKSYIDTSKCVAMVTGGGAFGPGELFRFDGLIWRPLEFEDFRSGTLRSGYVRFDTSTPGLYRYVGIAISNARVASGYFEHDAKGHIVTLSDQQMRSRQLDLYPEFAVIIAADQTKHQHDAAWAIERQQRELEALRETTERNGQADRVRERLLDKLKEVGMVLPKLTGSRRQIRWATNIRAAWAIRSPNSPQLMSETTARWWIEHKDGFDLEGVIQHYMEL